MLKRNSADGINRFFAANSDEEHYATFAGALYRLLDKNDVDLDERTVFGAGVGPGRVLVHLVGRDRPAVVAGLGFSVVAVDLARSASPRATS